jgi:hypothetical protein
VLYTFTASSPGSASRRALCVVCLCLHCSRRLRVADEVSADEGEILQGITLTEGWWQVLRKGKLGLFPGNYVEVRWDFRALRVVQRRLQRRPVALPLATMVRILCLR